MVNHVKIRSAFLAVFCAAFLTACQSTQPAELYSFPPVQDMAQPLDSYLPRYTLDDFSLVMLEPSSLIPASKEHLSSEQIIWETSEISTELVTGKDGAISEIFHIASPSHNATFSISFLDEQEASRRHVAYEGKEIDTSLVSGVQWEHFTQPGSVGWLDETTFFFGGPLARDYVVYDTAAKTARPLDPQGIIPDDVLFLKHSGGGRLAFYSGIQAAVYLYDHNADIPWMQAYAAEPPHAWDMPPGLLWDESESLYLSLGMPDNAVIHLSTAEQSATRILSFLPPTHKAGLQQNYFVLDMTGEKSNTRQSLFFEPQANAIYFAVDGLYLGDYYGYALIRQSDRLLFCNLEERLVYALPFDLNVIQVPPLIYQIPGDFAGTYISFGFPTTRDENIYRVILP